MIAILTWMCAAALLGLSVLVVYEWFWAIVALLPWHRRQVVPAAERTRFAVVIPAHNEETVLATTLASLAQADYPRDRLHVTVVADRSIRRATA